MTIASFVVGAGMACWFMLFHFTDKWKMSGPQQPSGNYIYAHVEHGGVTYFNAMQSTASHLYLPVWIFFFVGILAVNASRGTNAFKRSAPDRHDLNQLPVMLLGAAVAVAIVYFWGHQILNSLINSPFGPSGDSLSQVDHN